MKKSWTEIKSEIEQEIDVIWYEEPREVKASNRGLFPSGAGSHGMATGNVVYQVADTYAAGFGCAAKAIEKILRDDTYSLDQVKDIFMTLYGSLTERMGGKSPNGAAYMNMPKVWRYYSDIVDSIDNINSKEIFASLFWSFENYIKRLNMWFCQIFTWEVMGGLRCSKTVADYERLLDLTLCTEPYMKNAAETRI